MAAINKYMYVTSIQFLHLHKNTSTHNLFASKASWAFSLLMFAGPLKMPLWFKTEKKIRFNSSLKSFGWSTNYHQTSTCHAMNINFEEITNLVLF